MKTVQIKYNPYTVETEMSVDGKPIGKESPYNNYVADKRLQRWIVPSSDGNWEGIFGQLRKLGERQIKVEFTGTTGDFQDLEYAKKEYGDCFDEIELIHKNKETARTIDFEEKMNQLQGLYEELMDGPAEELKNEEIQGDFERAIRSDFRIVVVGTMSSGKSTFLNALIGRYLLPEANTAKTAVRAEIRANNEKDGFIVSAFDDGNNLIEIDGKPIDNVEADINLMEKLNGMIDPSDPDGKKALASLIKLEGPIPNVPSANGLNIVFVDSPGPNFVLNKNHEKVMDEAINDEENGLILFIMDGTKLADDGCDGILHKISNALEMSRNGKQSRDRVLFVANKMDCFDQEKEAEKYEKVIKENIKPHLGKHDIDDPNLFLVSSETAKWIRMENNGISLTDFETEYFGPRVSRFNKPDYKLTEYASLNPDGKKLLDDKANDLANKGDKRGVAEIYSGIPAVELAIKEYLEKYAIPVKIKRVQDSFMEKVKDNKRLKDFRKELANDRGKFNRVKEDLLEKRNMLEENQELDKKLQELEAKVEGIDFDSEHFVDKRAEIVGKILQLYSGSGDKVPEEEAKVKLKEFVDAINKIGEEAQELFGDVRTEGLEKCQGILSEYEEYLIKLDTEGLFKIGEDFDIKELSAFKEFDPEDLIKGVYHNYEGVQYTTIREQDGYKRGRLKRVKNPLKRIGIWFQGRVLDMDSAFEMIPTYRNRETKEPYVRLQDLIQDIVTPIGDSVDDEIRDATEETKDRIENLKLATKQKLRDLSEMIAKRLDEIEKMTVEYDQLQQDVDADTEKDKWIEDFCAKVEGITEI